MSISGISSDPTVYQNHPSSPFQQVRKDFAALKTSLTSGDLKGAQAAFVTLQQDMQAAGQSGQQTGANSQLSTDLAAVGTALDKGDLSGAQKAFAAVQQDMQQAQKTHRHHHHHSGSAQNTQNTRSNPFTDLAAIGKALDSGNLSAAQKAFAALQQDLGNSDGQSTTSTPGTDLTALSTSLQSNDLTGAQNAFATLMQDLQNTIGTLGNSTSQAVGTSIDVAT